MLKDTHAKFTAMIKGTNDDARSYGKPPSLPRISIEENNVLREVLAEKLDRKRLSLNANQRKRLSTKAICLDKLVLQDVAHLFQSETILR